MLKNTIVFVLITLFSMAALGQATAVKPVYFSGDLTAVADKKFTIKDAKGGSADVMVTDKTVFKRVSAETMSLTAATAGKLEEIGVGDKLTVSALPDGSGFAARTVYYVTSADITAKQNKERQEWRTRGISGKVTAANAQTNQVTVEVRGLTGAATSVTVTPKADAKIKRYAEDSIKYEDAKDSSIAAIKPGDMIQALGDKSADGTSLTAEQVVTGAFQTIAGTVKSIDAAKNEVVITNLQTNKDLIIDAGEAKLMKRFPAADAERMAGAQMPGGARPAGGGAQPPGGGAQPAGGPGRVMMGGPGGMGMRPGGAGGNLNEMIERFPNITVADVKAGDMIAIVSSKNGATNRVKALKFVAGVEPFVRMAQMAAAASGGRGGRGGGVDFNIPGLDGIGFP